MNSHFHFIVPVWGEDYTELFSNICLPQLLTQNNLEYFEGDSTALFVILTRHKDAQLLQKSDAFARLKQLVPIKVVYIDGLVDFHLPHRAMSQCYQLAMELPQVVRGTTSFVFLTADSFWSDGTLRRLHELREGGALVVMVAGLRVVREWFVNVLTKQGCRISDTALGGNRELVRIAIDNLHPMSLAHNWLTDGGFLERWPSHIYWLLQEALVVHAFHLHPLLVRAPRSKVKIRTTIDGDFLRQLGYPQRYFHIVCDSDEIVGLELSPKSKSWNQPLSTPSLAAVRKFGLLYADSLHWMFFKRRIIFKADPTFSIPQEILDNADRVVREVYRYRLLLIAFQKLLPVAKRLRQIWVKAGRLRRHG